MKQKISMINKSSFVKFMKYPNRKNSIQWTHSTIAIWNVFGFFLLDRAYGWAHDSVLGNTRRGGNSRDNSRSAGCTTNSIDKKLVN